ncbi:MAG: hypothetical protein BLM47_12835 [Candidatus Reconcilbacillus cellulovorans]|uniref:Glycosyltransferase RgtA/B/C/D-like domain-containing protein n=1 Tax=Candidatus Reconcilbacillus cellulovorans TaxID=1906605 RepID=A0A2A6DWX8_9BACL|nr:MAG: hypothetical protein BLM47_12835 [Candidatus Reconcilbacillus cellulovorans]
MGIFARYDSMWYIGIAENGYMEEPSPNHPHQANWAFFPLFPILIRLLDLALNDKILSGAIISNTCLVIGLYILYKMVEMLSDSGVAFRACLYILIFPTSWFFSAVYTESVFLLLSVMCFYLAYSGKWWSVGLIGILASLSRPQGIILLFPLAYIYWKRNRRINFNAIALLGFPLGIGIYMLYLYKLTGDPLAFSHIQRAWGRKFSIPFEPVFDYIRNPYIWGHYNNDFGPISFILTVLFLIFLPFVFRYLGFSFGIYTLLLLAVPLSTNTFMSISRYLLVIFPIFIIFGIFGKNKFWHYSFILMFSTFLGLAVIAFSNGYSGII